MTSKSRVLNPIIAVALIASCANLLATDSKAQTAPGAAKEAPATASATPTKLQGVAVEHAVATDKASTPDKLKLSAQATISRYKNDWRMFLGNPMRTGHALIDAPVFPAGKVRWTFPAEGPIDSSPAIVKGIVYVGSDDHNVYAVEEKSGRLIWRSQLGEKVKSSPCVTDTNVVIGCEDKKLYCLDKQSGKIVWSFDTADRVSSSPAVVDGVAYVGSWDG